MDNINCLNVAEIAALIESWMDDAYNAGYHMGYDTGMDQGYASGRYDKEN